MATYKEIKGVTVQTKDTDPVLNVGSWAAGGDTNKSGQGRGSAGTQTSNLAFGGDSPNNDYVEEYNGTSWTEVADMNTGKTYGFGCGANAESAMASGGYTNPSGPWFTVTETWNGSSWTEVNDMNTARGDGGMFGVVPGSIAAGGYSGTLNTAVENWDGSSWTEVAELNTGRYYGCGIGTTNTAGLIVGGSTPSATAANESWNGSAWTELNDLNTARNRAGGSGTSTAGLAYSGAPFPKGNTESWDGTSWTEVADLATARYGVASSPSGTSQLALASGGYTTTQVSNTEEWSFPPTDSDILTEGSVFLSAGTTLKAFGKAGGIPSATFASGGNLNTKRLDATAGGSAQNSFLFISGYPNSVLVESYDGTSWTEIADVNTSRQLGGASAKAPAPTMLFFGGNASPQYKLTEQFDGTSWTEVADLNTNRDYSGGGAGTSTSALCVGGYGNPAAYLAITESFDGTSWTEVGDLNVARYGGATGGTGTSARCVAGAPPTNPPAAGDKNEGWDGTSWTEAAEHSDNSAGRAGFGDSKDFFMVAGGNATASSEFWNGTSWTETADTAGSGQRINMGGGTTVAGIITKASGPTAEAKSTEEFTADNGILTVTDS